jgi:hypothetical protein
MANGNLTTMNLLALLAGLLPWAATPVSAFTRIYIACSLLSLEAQAITWLGRGTLDALFPLNAAVGIGAALWQVRAKRPMWAWAGAMTRVLPMPVVVALLAVAVVLNLWRPVQAADAYELDRVAHIERSGTLAYSTSLDPKANIVSTFYELVLADLGGVPGIGAWLVRLHGVFGVLIFSLAVAAVQTWLPFPASMWARTLVFVAPVVFHQFVLIKNDLFIAAPALVALAWAAGSGDRTGFRQLFWAGWLGGLVAAAKLTNLALALVIAGSVYVRQRARPPLLAVGAGVAAGLVAGGLVLTLWPNARVYGAPVAVREVDAMDNINRSASEAAVGLARFSISLVDMSLFTRVAWPGRGGWGGAFGFPLMVALALLLASWRTHAESRRALVIGGLGLLALGITFPDADLAHRLAMGPGLLIIAAGVSASQRVPGRWVRPALIGAVLLSTAQIARSAALYLTRI